MREIALAMPVGISVRRSQAVLCGTEPVHPGVELYDSVYPDQKQEDEEELQHALLVAFPEDGNEDEGEQEPPVASQGHQQVRIIGAEPAGEQHYGDEPQHDPEQEVVHAWQVASPQVHHQPNEVEKRD
jgi:hypothetical protein